jgi:hypothetical protein
VRTDGSLWTWGNDELGQLGIPSFTLKPLQIFFKPGLVLSTRQKQSAVSPLIIFPNPATNLVSITGADTTLPIELWNMIGHLVRKLPARTSSIDISGYRPGVYLIRNGARSTRLVITNTLTSFQISSQRPFVTLGLCNMEVLPSNSLCPSRTTASGPCLSLGRLFSYGRKPPTWLHCKRKIR